MFFSMNQFHITSLPQEWCENWKSYKICKVIVKIRAYKEKFQNSEYFVTVGSWEPKGFIPCITLLDETDWDKWERIIRNSIQLENNEAKKILFDQSSSIKISDVQQKGKRFLIFQKQSIFFQILWKSRFHS